MTGSLYERRRNLGLAGGCLWLTAVGAAFAAWSLLATRSTLAIWLLVAIAAFAVMLTIFGIAMIRRVLRSLFVSDVQTSGARRIMRQFGVIVATEGIACAIVSWACIANHHWILIVPLTLIIVGIHFLPLAKLFDVPRYYVTGILFCAFPIVTMLWIPASAHVGHARSWLTVPSVGCALVALATAWAGLNEIRRSVPRTRVLL